MRYMLALAAFLVGLQLLAQNKERMTAEKLWELARVSLDDVSADGQLLLFGVTRYNIPENKGNRDLYLLNRSSGESRRITQRPGYESGGQFVGDRIGFLHQGQYFLVDQNGENATQVTDIEGGISGVRLYPQADGSFRMLFVHEVEANNRPLDRYSTLEEANFHVFDDLMYRHWDSWENYRYSHLCVADYQPGSTVRSFRDLLENQPFDVPVPPFGGAESYTLSPDGNTVVYEAKKLQGKAFAEQTNSQLYAFDLRSGAEKLLSRGMMGYDKSPQFSPDGSQLAWLSMRTNGYESDVNDLIVMDLNSGEKTAVLVASGNYEQLTLQSFRWANNQSLFAGVPIDGTNQIFEVELKKKGVELQQSTKGDYNYNHFEVADGMLLVERQDMNHATEIYAVNPSKGQAEQLTKVNDEIYKQMELSKVEKRMVPTSDGQEMLTWVIYPPDFDPQKKYPTLLYCQGGPQAQVSQFYSFRWNFQLMAAEGYIVVAPNRRGLPGFGRSWNEQISGDWGGQAMQDYLSAIDALSNEPYVDREKLGCVGASYGGYSVYMLAGIHEGRFKAFISHCGLFDLESWYLSTEEMFFANYDLGGPFWDEENAESYSRFDPKDYVDRWDTPILVIHGGKDYRVPLNQGMEAFNAAQLRGIPSRFLYFPEEGHWVLSPQNGLVWHDQFFQWLNQWLH